MNLHWSKKPKPAPRRMDEDSGAQIAYEDTRMGRGRRESDSKHGSRIEVGPLAIFILGAVLTIVVAVVGYSYKSSQDNTTYEIHALRTDLGKVLQDRAADAEWKTDMSRWRDQTDGKLDGLDQRLDTLQARQNARPFPWQKPAQQPSQRTGQN